jgi:HAT1-interacting factor 1
MLTTESFDAAVQDLSTALQLKLGIYAPSDPIISEAHYKLSLALEFAQQPSPEENKQKALEHLDAAIDSVKQRVTILESQDKHTEAKDAKEMIEELSVKAEEMRKPAKEGIDVGAMFGSSGGFSEALQQKLAESLAGSANDLTSFVRKKEKPKAGSDTTPVGEKRKLDDDVEESAEKKR